MPGSSSRPPSGALAAPGRRRLAGGAPAPDRWRLRSARRGSPSPMPARSGPRSRSSSWLAAAVAALLAAPGATAGWLRRTRRALRRMADRRERRLARRLAAGYGLLVGADTAGPISASPARRPSWPGRCSPARPSRSTARAVGWALVGIAARTWPARASASTAAAARGLALVGLRARRGERAAAACTSPCSSRCLRSREGVGRLRRLVRTGSCRPGRAASAGSAFPACRSRPATR